MANCLKATSKRSASPDALTSAKSHDTALKARGGDDIRSPALLTVRNQNCDACRTVVVVGPGLTVLVDKSGAKYGRQSRGVAAGHHLGGGEPGPHRPGCGPASRSSASTSTAGRRQQTATPSPSRSAGSARSAAPFDPPSPPRPQPTRRLPGRWLGHTGRALPQLVAAACQVGGLGSVARQLDGFVVGRA
jgi:hypothetical protein